MKRELRVVLKADQGSEPERAFVFKAPTIETQETIGDVYDAAVKAGSTREMADMLIKGLQPVLVGWENAEIEFDGAPSLKKIIAMTDLTELAAAFISGGSLTADDKKKSE
jgi:hypothetical protein